MNNRRLFSRGAQGEIVRAVQKRLLQEGFDPKGADGIYGGDTATSVSAFQSAHRLPPSGTVDVETWRALMGQPPPPVRDRALGVTAAIEGHGYSLALGNFDGAGITWGIIGFTLRHGELSRLVGQIDAQDLSIVDSIFGEKAAELRRMMSAAWTEQREWANSISVGHRKVNLAEPWKSMFAYLGEIEEVQSLQLRRADESYFQPSLETAADHGLRSELGVALAFDIHVQNGGIKPAARRQIAEELERNPPRSEIEIRRTVADAVADHAAMRWRENVRKRKRAIAEARGVVHGLRLELRDWGLDEIEYRAD